MICEGCKRDCVVTTTWSWRLTRINPRTGAATVEQRSRTLCLRCGPSEEA